jgi:hypothetical protein
VVTIKIQGSDTEYEVKKGPAALLALSLTTAGLITGGLWSKLSLPERPAPSAAAGKDPDSVSPAGAGAPANIVESNSPPLVSDPRTAEREEGDRASTSDPTSNPTAEETSVVTKGKVFFDSASLIEWGKSIQEGASSAYSDALATVASFVEEMNIQKEIPITAKVSDVNAVHGVGGESVLEIPALSSLSLKRVSTEPDPSIPEWAITSAKGIGITDLAGVKEVAPGVYAHCVDGSCTPIPGPGEVSEANEFSTSIPPIVGDFQQGADAAELGTVPVVEEHANATGAIQEVSQREESAVRQTAEAPTPPATEVQAPSESAPAADLKIEGTKVEEPRVEKKLLEIKNGVVEGLVNGAVIEVSENGKTERLTILLGPNTIGTSVRWKGGELGTISRRSSSDINVTIKVIPGFKGTLEFVPVEVLQKEQAEAIALQRAQQAERIKGAIKKESSSHVVIDGASKNSPYVKDAIAQVLAENKDNVVLFIKTVPGPCPPCTTYQPELKQLAERVEREAIQLAGRKVVIVEAVFTSFEDADNALGISKVPRTDLILPVGARKPTSTPPNAKVFEYESMAFIGSTTAKGLLDWASERIGK